jgi:hypothetical protein
MSSINCSASLVRALAAGLVVDERRAQQVTTKEPVTRSS